MVMHANYLHKSECSMIEALDALEKAVYDEIKAQKHLVIQQ